MFLVDRAINTDGGAKTLLALVLLDSPQHGGQGGCAQAGRARGHNLADSVCGHTVLLQRTQTQTHQDLVGLLYSILLPGKQIGCEQWAGLGSAPSSSKLPHEGGLIPSAEGSTAQHSNSEAPLPDPPPPRHTHASKPTPSLPSPVPTRIMETW